MYLLWKKFIHNFLFIINLRTINLFSIATNTGTREHGNTRTREHEDTGTRGQGNTRTRGHEDKGTRGHGDTRTRGHEDTRTRGHET